MPAEKAGKGKRLASPEPPVATVLDQAMKRRSPEASSGECSPEPELKRAKTPPSDHEQDELCSCFGNSTQLAPSKAMRGVRKAATKLGRLVLDRRSAAAEAEVVPVAQPVDVKEEPEPAPESSTATWVGVTEAAFPPANPEGLTAVLAGEAVPPGIATAPLRVAESDTVDSHEARQRIARLAHKVCTAVSTQALARAVLNDGISIEEAKAGCFDGLAATLRDKKLIDCTKLMLMRFCHLTTRNTPRDELPTLPETLNVRVILASYMIAYKPSHVFEHEGTLEKAVKEASLPLLECFERMCTAAAEGGWPGVAMADKQAFPKLLACYLEAFKAWKVPDEAKLSQRIKHALTALYQAQGHLPAGEGESDSKLRQEFQNQIHRLRYKLYQIAGAEVLRQFDVDAGRAGQALPTPPPPTASASAPGTSGYSSLQSCGMTNEQLAHELLLDSRFKLDEYGLHSASDPVYAEIRKTFHHEYWQSLVADLCLDKPCYTRVLNVLKEILDGASDLRRGTPEVEVLTKSIDIELIRQQLENDALEWGASASLVRDLSEILLKIGKEERREMVTQKTMEVVKAMDGAYTKRERATAFCDALEFMLDTLNVIRIDDANSRLRLIAPVIRDHGIDYERAHLDKKIQEGVVTTVTLEDGTVVLCQTAAWLEAALEIFLSDVLTKRFAHTYAPSIVEALDFSSGKVDLALLRSGKEAARETMLEAIAASTPSALLAAHSVALLGIVTGDVLPDGVTRETCPELLWLDQDRLKTARDEFSYNVGMATALVGLSTTLRSLSGGDIEPAMAELRLLAANPYQKRRPTANDVPTLVIEAFQKLTLSEADKRTVAAAAMKCIDPSNGVWKIFRDRMYSLWAAQLRTGEKRSDKLTDLFQSLNIPKVAFAVALRAAAQASVIRNVAVLNKNVHVKHYNAILPAKAKVVLQKLRDRRSARARGCFKGLVGKVIKSNRDAKKHGSGKSPGCFKAIVSKVLGFKK